MAVQLVNVTASWTPEGGTEVSTQCLLEVSGFGSEREVNELTCLNDETIVAVGAKKHDTLNLKAPYDETASAFHETVLASYDANTKGTLKLEFDNKPSGGTNGTTFSGTAYITAAKIDNDSKVLTTAFGAKWEGSPTRTKAA